MNINSVFDHFKNDIPKMNIIAQGFQNSIYYHSVLSFDSIFKEFVEFYNSKNTIEPSLKLNTQTGTTKIVTSTPVTTKRKTIKKAVTKTTKVSTDEKDKKDVKTITFGSDIKIQLNNLIGLLGYEFSNSIIFVSFLPVIVNQLIESIRNAEEYKSIYKTVIKIVNIYRFNNSSIFVDDNDYKIDDGKLTIKIDDKLTTNEERFKEIFAYLKIKIGKNSLVNLEDDKNTIISKLRTIVENTKTNTCYIKSVDNLCINLENTKLCYRGYFLKIWEILFKETYADYFEYENVYPKFKQDLESDMNRIEAPLITAMSKEIPNISQIYAKHINIIKEYFKYLYKKAKSVIYDNDERVSIINIVIEEYFYEHLGAIFLNMLNILAKNVVSMHQYINAINKSVKLQFIELFQGLRQTSPRLYTFDESQLMILHYILLTKKSIDDFLN